MKISSIEELSPIIDRYRVEIEKRGKWTWEGFDEVLEDAGINLGWLLTPFLQSILETYLFCRPYTMMAFQEPYLKQPSVWVEAKLLLDGLLG